MFFIKCSCSLLSSRSHCSSSSETKRMCHKPLCAYCFLQSLQIIVVSSANMNKSPLVIDSGRSFTKIENNFNPSIEPWGAPYVMVLDLDWYPGKLHNCFRTDIIIKPGKQVIYIPMAFSFSSKMMWLTVSNVFWKSMKSTPTFRPLSTALFHVSVKWSKWLSVE